MKKAQSIIAVSTIFLSSLSLAQMNACNPVELSVSAEQNIDFEILFHNGLATVFQDEIGAKTEVVSNTYKVRFGESAHNVEVTVALPEDFDLNLSNEDLKKSLHFSIDRRGGTNPEDHTPIVVSVDPVSRLAKVAVNLENKSIENKRVKWEFQLFQPTGSFKRVEDYPTDVIMTYTRKLIATDGKFDSSPIYFNVMNMPQFVSVMHKRSRCLLKSYKYVGGTYEVYEGINKQVILLGDNRAMPLTVELDLAGPPLGLQGKMIPQLKLY